jgi:hypothetical protein
VQVSKTFTPDQQGDASGGAVNIDLKDIPDETSFQIRGQAGFNSQVKDAGDQFLTYEGSNLGQWGQYEGAGIPRDLIGQTWPNAVGGSRGSPAGDDYKWSMSGGGKWEIDEGVKVGGFASLFYERDSSYFNGGTDDSWWITPNEGVVPQYSQGTPSQLQFQSSLLDIEQGPRLIGERPMTDDHSVDRAAEKRRGGFAQSRHRRAVGGIEHERGNGPAAADAQVIGERRQPCRVRVPHAPPRARSQQPGQARSQCACHLHLRPRPPCSRRPLEYARTPSFVGRRRRASRTGG